MIILAIVGIVAFVVALSWRPSDPDSRSFVPSDRVAPTTSSGAYEAGLAGCPDGTCIASRGENLTGWTVNGRISTQYPPAVTRAEPVCVQPQPERLPAPKPELPPGVTEVPIEINVGGVWIRKEDLYRR